MAHRHKWISLFATNFLGVFNDNFLKNSIIFISVSWLLPSWLSQSQLISVVASALVVPYLLFSPIGGRLAVRYSKLKIFRILKLVEIPIMLLACVAFYYQWVIVAVLSVFALGTQSCLYSPSKYSLIRDIGGEERLFVPDGAAAMQGQQNAGFKTVHVLPGHGGDNVQPLRIQAARGRAGVVHQAAPGFAVGHRRARGARGEHDGGQMLARHLGNRRGIGGLARHLHVGRQINAGQRMGGHIAARVGQQDQVLWIRLVQLLQHLLKALAG